MFLKWSVVQVGHPFFLRQKCYEVQTQTLIRVYKDHSYIYCKEKYNKSTNLFRFSQSLTSVETDFAFYIFSTGPSKKAFVTSIVSPFSKIFPAAISCFTTSLGTCTVGTVCTNTASRRLLLIALEWGHLFTILFILDRPQTRGYPNLGASTRLCLLLDKIRTD